MQTDLERMAAFTKGGSAQEAMAEGDQISYCFPCTLSQRACWYLDQISPGTSANNIAVRFLLEGDVKPELIERAFREMVARHEVLRTRFQAQDGVPKQLVEPVAPFALQVIDLSAMEESQRQSEADRLAAEEARVGFDLRRLPLLRATLLRMESEKFVLLVTIHHIVSDGWSIGILTDELGLLYEASVEERNPETPALEIQYADYACWQNDRLESGELDELIEQRRQKLDRFQPLVIPTDFERPSKQTSRGAIESLLLPRDLTNALQDFSAGRGCTLFVTMFSAFLVLLKQESGSDDIVVRTQTAGRERVELEPLIGWFVNSILLRSDLSGDPTFAALVERTRAAVLEAFEFKDVPFERLMEVIHPQRSLLRHPPFQVNFIFQRDLVRPWTKGGISLKPLPSKAAGTFVDLNFFLVERRDGWRLSVDVNEDVFRVETGVYFLRKLVRILEIVAREPERKLSEIELPECRRTREQESRPSAVVTAMNAEARSPLERDLLAIWQTVLRSEQVGPDSNFFDLGGHSLLAVQLLSIVREKWGSRISLAALFREPTIAAMARLIAAADQAGSGDLIRIQPAGSRPPFFMLGGDHFFRPLARHLGPDQPMLGVSLQPYEGRPEPTPFAEIAKDVAHAIIAAYPPGPYILGGWCVDGAIAYEVARELRAMNRRVKLVALIDVINPVYRRYLKSPQKVLGRALKRTFSRANEALTAKSQGSSRSLWSELRDTGRRATEALLLRNQGIAQDEVIVQNDPDRQEFRRLLYKAEQQYVPAPIDVPVLLVRSELSPYQEPDLGWGNLSSAGLEVVEVNGGHVDMFREPFVAALASAIAKRLETAAHLEHAS